MTTPRWAPIPDWSYEVSDDGRVRRTVAGNGTRMGRDRKLATVNGYRTVHLSRGKDRWLVGVHRLVATAFVPKPEGCDVVNHLDGNKTNNRASNLEWTTAAGNAAHAQATGRYARGEQVRHLSKLSAEQVLAIRSEHAANNKRGQVEALARRYGVSGPAISCILKRKTWRHV